MQAKSIVFLFTLINISSYMFGVNFINNSCNNIVVSFTPESRQIVVYEQIPSKQSLVVDDINSSSITWAENDNDLDVRDKSLRYFRLIHPKKYIPNIDKVIFNTSANASNTIDITITRKANRKSKSKIAMFSLISAAAVGITYYLYNKSNKKTK